MMRSFPLGRIYGIQVNVHPSFALIVLFVAIDQRRLGDGGVGAFLFALLLTTLVFACVILHELGHSFMAMQYGIRVHGITLWPMGGVALMEQVPTRPAAETLVAIAGPAVNVAIALALVPWLVGYGVVRGFAGLGDYLAAVADGGSFGALLGYLLLVNVMLIAFNALPAFPMDGGRVLRAGLSAVVGREKGTRAAVLVGQAFAVGFIGVGVWFQYWSLLLVGLFVLVAAHAEGRAVRLESAMRRLQVGQFALWDRGGIGPRHPLTYALRGGPRDLVVTDEGRVVGMLWRAQLLNALNGGSGARTVEELMDADVVTADVDDSVYDVQQRMHRMNRWAVPVVEDGLYRGIFTAERFVHVYRHLAPAPARGASTGFTQALGDLVRAWVR
jgi:Zn-dependent protease